MLEGIEAMEAFFRSIHMPVSISELGVELTDDQIEMCIRDRTDALEEAMTAESSDTGADSSTGSGEQGESGNSASS